MLRKQVPIGWNYIPSPMLLPIRKIRLRLLLLLLKRQKAARRLGIGLNAGHDLSLLNLNYFYKNIPWLDEVSIGHALISDALYLGLERTIQEYKNCLR